VNLFKCFKKKPAPEPTPEPEPVEYGAEYRNLYGSVVSTDTSSLAWYTTKCKRYRAKYEEVTKKTGVPWEVVGVIHGLEGGFNFSTCLHNGEAIIGTGKKTTLVPKGRGPFATWEEAAIDAFAIKKLMPVWDIEHTLYFLEGFNGWGYRKYHPEVKSPYLWGLTNHHTKGKYVADGKFDPSARTKQTGAAIILKELGFS
jgi:lysozyme family protein